MKRSEIMLKENSMYYMGLSMFPTFIPGDLLYFKPCAEGEIVRGDVLIFRPSGEEKNIVHRVVSVGPIRTRGDNNSKTDNFILSESEILGKVISLDRNSKKWKVAGGWMGLIKADSIRFLRKIEKRFQGVFRPVYYWVSRKGLMREYFLKKGKIRLIAFKKPLGTEFLLLIGRCVIARLRPERREWEIRKPFRLFIDVTTLPGREDLNKE